MAKQTIVSNKLYPVYGPYSHAVRAGEFIFTHGTVGVDAQGQLPGRGAGRADMAGQCQQTLENLGTALELLGGSLRDVVRVRAFLPHHCRPGRPGVPSFDETFDAVYGRYFLPPRPARAALQQGLFLAELLVEMEALAVLNRPKRLIEAAALPPLRRPYAQGGMVAGNLLFLRGFTAQDRHGDLVGRGDMRAQTEHTFANMAVVLQEVGGSLADLVQTHVTLTDWHAYQDYNEVYNRHVREPFPTRVTWQGGLGREGLLIEIESVAAPGVPRLTVDAAIPQPGRSILQRRGDVIYSERLAPGRAAYAQAVRVGDLVFVSDQQGVEAQGRLVGPGDIASQTRQALVNLRTILHLLEFSLEDVVKTTVMLTDWRHYAPYNDVYARFFQAPYPARSTICAGIARPGALIAIEAIAVAGARQQAIAVTNA
jgi:2-iminobutanoate/2-iminopropanoate deaminase